MRAVIVCDSFAFAAKATAALRHVGFGAGVNVRWAVKCWPLNALNESEVVKMTLGESSNVHLIVFSTHSARRFPLFLRNWLGRWAALRKVPDAALGVIRADDDSELAEPACSELRQFAEEHGLNFIIGEGLSTDNLRKLFIRFAPAHGLPNRWTRDSWRAQSTRQRESPNDRSLCATLEGGKSDTRQQAVNTPNPNLGPQ
jgi:hypothetical protein